MRVEPLVKVGGVIMKKNRQQKYLEHLKINTSDFERNLKSRFRHRDRGTHSGRVGGK
jgi:hypothetical protein